MRRTFTLILALLMVFSVIGHTPEKGIQAKKKLIESAEFVKNKFKTIDGERIHFNSKRANSQTILKSAQVIKQRLDSIIDEELDSITKQIRLSSKTIFKYNTNGNITQETYYLWDKISGKWIGDWKFETFWNAQGKQFQTIDSEWDAVTQKWINGYKNETNYNANGLISIESYSSWDKTSEKWQNDMKTEYTYNSSGNKSQEIGYMFDADINQWEISMKNEYTYNSSGKLTLEARYFSDGGSNYFMFSKSEYSYNTDGSLKQTINYTSDFMGGWMLSSKNEFIYDSSGNLTHEINYVSNQQSSELIATWKDEYVFDSSGNLSQEINYEWDEATKKWFIDRKSEYSFNNSYSYNELLLPYSDLENYFRHMITAGINYQRDEDTGELVLYGKMIAYYSPVNISGINDISEHELTVFPNPASEFIMIGSGHLNQQVLIELFDMKGSKIVSGYLTGNEKLYVNQLNSGVYICRVQFNDRIVNTKLVKK